MIGAGSLLEAMEHVRLSRAFMAALRDGTDETQARVTEILGKGPLCSCGDTLKLFPDKCFDDAWTSRLCAGRQAIERANIQAQLEKLEPIA